MEALSMSRKVALITGASSGIGQATAILFAKLGAWLALVGRDEDRLKETLVSCQQAAKEQDHMKESIDPFICISADLADVKQIELAYKKTMQHFNKLDILINNAGMLARDNIENFDLEVFQRTMDVNLRSAILLTNHAVPELIKTKGSIVNVSSVCGTRAFTGILSYCISKAAMDQFTQCTALELAPKGVRVNSVNPGVVRTGLHRSGGMSEDVYSQFLDTAKATHPLGRYAQSEEVARAIGFLASEAASFTTAALLSVDGGRGAACPR